MTTDNDRRLIRDHEVMLNGNRYSIIGDPLRRIESRYPGKIVIGDTTRDSRPRTSLIAWSDFSGGMGKNRLTGATGVDRLWWSTLDTSYEGHLVLPPEVRALPVYSGVGIVTSIGELGGFIYVVYNRAVHRYDPVTGWGDAVHTLAGDPTDVANVHIGTTAYLAIIHTEGVSYTSDGNSWTDNTTARDTSDDFSLDATPLTHPFSIIEMGTNLLIGDSEDNALYAFTKSGVRIPANDILNLPTTDLQGVARAGDDIWLLDRAGQVFLIDEDGTRQSEFDFLLDPLNTDARGIAVKADGITIVVVDRGRRKVFTYQKTTDQTRVPGLDFSPSIPSELQEITAHDGIIWGISSGDMSKLFAFTTMGVREEGRDISLPSGTWEYLTNDGTTLWAYNSDDEKLYAWSLTIRARDLSRERVLVINNGDPQGIFATGGTVYVWDGTDGVLYPYETD